MKFWASRKEVQELRAELQRLESRMTELSFRTGWGYSFSVPVKPPKRDEIVVSTSMEIPSIRNISTTEMLSALMDRLKLVAHVNASGPIVLKRKPK